MTEPNDVAEVAPTPFIYRFSASELIRVGILGAMVGILAPLLSTLLGKYVIEPLFCREGSSFGLCAEGGSIAFGVAITLLSVVALLVLASFRAYQPLLNVVAPLAALWGLDQYLGTVAADHRVEYYLFSTILFALAYVMFFLLLRFRRFAISLVLIGVMVALARLELMA